MPAQYLAHGVPDKSKRGCPAKRANDRTTLDEEDEEPSQDKIRKVSILAIVTCNVACLTLISSGGVAAKKLHPIQDVLLPRRRSPRIRLPITRTTRLGI